MNPGELIKLCREVRGISQNDLISGTSIPQTRLSRIESGKSEPRVAELQALCRGLDVRVELVLQMMEYEKKVTPDPFNNKKREIELFESLLKTAVQIRVINKKAEEYIPKF